MPPIINFGDGGFGDGYFGGIPGVNTKYESSILQDLLNYFDENDIRIRENHNSLGAQLLNSVATQLEELQTKLAMEQSVSNMGDIPLNIDNRGVYYSIRIPFAFDLPINDLGVLQPPSTVIGQTADGQVVVVKPYDDTLPIPSRIVQDTTADVAELSNPTLCDITGTGSPVILNPGKLPIPNSLVFSIDGMGPTTSLINIKISGELDPPAVWYQDVQINSEKLIITDDGIYETKSIWSSVDTLTIHGLPSGCRLQCWFLPVNLPAVRDKGRPYTHFAYRDVAFPRFWQLDNLLLKEVYKRTRFSEYEIINPYRLPTPIVDVAPESHTSGLYITDGTTLYYGDRRTPLPERLYDTGLMQEPLFGINVFYDDSKTDDNRWVVVQPSANARAAECVQYKYIVEDPNNNLFTLEPTGEFSVFKDNIGWNKGTPSAVSFPVTDSGTYSITLEMLDTSNVKTYDLFVYGNFDFTCLANIDLSTLVPEIKGIAFDAYDRLWVWTGDFVVPLKISYDGYIFDPNTRILYMTDAYTRIWIV